MSLSDDKRNIFTTIGAYTSFMEQKNVPKASDLYPSINNKQDIIPFLLDTLKSVAGTDSLKQTISGMLTNLVSSAETKIKTVLKKQFIQSNSDDNLPNKFRDDGYDIKVKKIDIKNKLKEFKNSDVGKLLYNQTNIEDVDSKLRNAIENAYTPRTILDLFVVNYDDNTDSFNIKPTNTGATLNIGKLMVQFIDKTEIVNENELVTNTLDTIYGTISNKLKKTPAEILSELETQKLISNALSGDDSFLILPKEYEELEKRADELSKGITYADLGCGMMKMSLPFSNLNNIIRTISGSTDPYVIGNTLENALYDSTSDNTQTTEENKETMKDNFFQKLIRIFIEQLTYLVTQQPQIRMLMAIFNAIQYNGDIKIDKPIFDMKKFKTLIMCLINEILSMVAEYIFNLVVSYLMKLLSPIIKKILKEKINQFINIFKSLTPAKKFLKLTNST